MSKAKQKSSTSAVKVSSPSRKRVTQSNDRGAHWKSGAKGHSASKAPIEPADYITQMEALGYVLVAAAAPGAPGFFEYAPSSVSERAMTQAGVLRHRAFYSGVHFNRRMAALLTAAGKIDGQVAVPERGKPTAKQLRGELVRLLGDTPETLAHINETVAREVRAGRAEGGAA